MSRMLLPMFSSRIFMVLSPTFKPLIHFEFVLMCSVSRWSIFFFLHVSVQFSNTIYRIDGFDPIVCSCLLCPILIDHKSTGLITPFPLHHLLILLFQMASPRQILPWLPYRKSKMPALLFVHITFIFG